MSGILFHDSMNLKVPGYIVACLASDVSQSSSAMVFSLLLLIFVLRGAFL